MDTTSVAFWLKITAVIVLAEVLPLTAIGYYYFSREQKKIEVRCILVLIYSFWHLCLCCRTEQNIFLQKVGTAK